MKTKYNYEVRLTTKQLSVLQHAAELLSRIGLGQWRHILNYLPLIEDIDHSAYKFDLDTIGSILSKYMKRGIDGYNSSLGICSKEVGPYAACAYELYKEFDKRLSWDRAIANGEIKDGEARKWPKMSSLNYDGAIKISGEPLPEIINSERGRGFYVDDIVTWRHLTGKVIYVVPPDTWIGDFINPEAKCFYDFSALRLNKKRTRSKKSYIVETSDKKIYWPNVSDLRLNNEC